MAHVYLGRQNCLPGEVYYQLQIRYPDIPDLYQIIWRYIYRAGVEAARDYNARITEEESKVSPSMRILCDPKIAKTFHFDEIDKIQCLAIYQKMEYDATRCN